MKCFVFILTAVLTFLSSSCSIFGNKAMTNKKEQNPCRGVYYSLFVRSFADSDGDGIGDFNGITSKLDYLERLGVTGVWLLPIYASHSYHGYDVDDYYSTNSEYGTIEDLENLCAAAAKRGISIILDIPLNHSSVHNSWFVESINPDSRWHNWYRWVKPGDPEINFKSVAWGHLVWNELGGNYYSGIYSHGMPDFNHDNPDVRKEFKRVLKFWLDKGVSGFRFDAAKHLYDGAKMPSSIKDGQERCIDFWKEMCGYVKSVKSDAFMVGEVWDTAGIRADYMRGIPATFHFDLGGKIINAVKTYDGTNNAIAKGLAHEYESYADKNPDYIDAPFLTNHDQGRFALLFKNDRDSIKLAASMYLFLPGIPFVYYGEEIGMNGAKPDEQIRTPFIWSADGDREQTKWIESKYNVKTVPCDEQEKDKDSILNYYRKAIDFRVKSQAFDSAKFYVYDTKNSAVTSWFLQGGSGGNKKIWCFFNLSRDKLEIDRPQESEECKLLFSAKKANLKKTNISLPPRSAVVIGN